MNEVEGVQSPHTLDAKKRDLQSFMSWFAAENGHLMIEEWLPRDTQAYLNYLERAGRAAATINRALAVLRHFSRWVIEQEGSPFRFGLPTRKIKELAVDEPTAKKLSRQELNALFRAADVLVKVEEERKNGRPRRNRAILGVLYYTGMRVSELCALRLSQYDGTYLRNPRRKGKSRTKKFYLNSECRRLLDDYLETERREDREHGAADLLFAPYGSNAPLTRQSVTNILDHLAEEANKRRKVNKIHIHPHKLRHTFGSEVRE